MNLDVRAKDITGQKFNRLTAIRPSTEKQKSRSVRWVCKCDCGNETVVCGYSLRSLRQQSCGCANFGKPMPIKHGHAIAGKHTTEYYSWTGMMDRCRNKNNKKHPRYGGRGISVCQRWKTFKNFYSDMGNKPKGMTLGRIDNDGNYEPSNCRWETMKQQANNRSNNRIIKHRGKTMNSSQWADYLGISRGALRTRLHRGWTIERALGES